MATSDPDIHDEEPDDDGLWPVFSGQGRLPPAGVAVLLAVGAFHGRTEMRARTVRDRWRRVAARLVERNSRILVLRQAAAAVRGQHVITTELLVPAHMSLREIDSWVVGVDLRLAVARDRLGDALAGEALRQLTDRRPPVDPHVLAMAGRLAADDLSDRGGRIRRCLAMLDPENTPDRYAQALELAARAATTRSPVAARTYADQLSSIVRAGNAETRRRREEMMIAAGYLQAIKAVPDAHPWRGWLIDRLDSVLTGGFGLADDVQDAAERLRCQIEENAEHSYLTWLLRGHLTRLGFTVFVSATESGDVSLHVRGGRLLLRSGLVTAGPPVGGPPPSPAFTRALDGLATLLGTAPAWDPDAFEVRYAGAARYETS